MSGIAGVYYLDGRPADRADLERMVDILAHRGSDGAGVWCEGPAGLGHRMLHTTPESLFEALPLASASGDLAVTADARIDNRDELMSALRVDRPSQEVGDSELILKAYEKWGEQCCEKLLGDFSFAIWDARSRKLFCARDHIGIKPFYYYSSPRLFAFASEIKALLCLREVPRKLNEVRVADYLVLNSEDTSITFYEGILRLPPACAMSVSRGRSNPRSYWALDPYREIKMSSDDEYAEAFREIFTEAVRCRLRSAFPTSSMLSGGLDSSSVVCVARELLSREGGERLHTFSAIFDEVPECDERPYINAVLAGNGLEPHFVKADQNGPLADIETILWHHDEPTWIPNLFWHNEIYEAAQLQGVRVLLSGAGGDDVVSHGDDYLVELALSFRWLTVMREVIDLSSRWDRTARQVLKAFVLRPILPDVALRAWLVFREHTGKVQPADAIVSSELARRVRLPERIRHIYRYRPVPLKTHRTNQYAGITHGLTPLIFEIVDSASAACCVSTRYPFYDKRLVEFCLAVPGDQKIRQGWTRFIMRHALREILPPEIRWRGGKTGLGQNFVRSLKKYDQERLDKLLEKDTAVIADYVDVAELRETYKRLAASGSVGDAFTVWRVAALACWLDQTGLTQ